MAEFRVVVGGRSHNANRLLLAGAKMTLEG